MKTVLIVDDNTTILGVMKRTFIEKGYEVTTASSAKEAGEYSEREFDAAIIDGLGGEWIRVCKEVRATRKIIFSVDEGIVEEARREGLEACLKGKDSILEIVSK